MQPAGEMNIPGGIISPAALAHAAAAGERPASAKDHASPPGMSETPGEKCPLEVPVPPLRLSKELQQPAWARPGRVTGLSLGVTSLGAGALPRFKCFAINFHNKPKPQELLIAK